MAGLEPVLIAGRWRLAAASSEFSPLNPLTGEQLAFRFPTSNWVDCDEALTAAAEASRQLRASAGKIPDFLEMFASAIERSAEVLAQQAAQETALPASPRLRDVELPRTVNQLRQAALAAKDGSWTLPTLDSKNNIRSFFAPLGPVITIGPNNFPLAFNGASGGDFAAAIAAGNPVIVKAHPSHPRTTQLLVELAFDSVQKVGLPDATVQLIYRLSHADGARLVSDPRTGATGFTGGRESGLALKAAADQAGKPIYLEMSSINPVVILTSALKERLPAIVDEFCGSCFMGAGQFCTNPGFVILIDGPETQEFLSAVIRKFQSTPGGTLLSPGVKQSLLSAIALLQRAGGELVTGGQEEPGPRIAVQNTLIRITGKQFLANPHQFQTEMFGAATLFVVASSIGQAAEVIGHLEGNLTGAIYISTKDCKVAEYEPIASQLRPRVGRLLQNKMPTGVAVSPAMNHGGPFPSTGHPGFTAVGIPAALRRFAMLQCFDNVPDDYLPALLQNRNSMNAWRSIDGVWTKDDVELP